jgi:hypothetical protein
MNQTPDFVSPGFWLLAIVGLFFLSLILCGYRVYMMKFITITPQGPNRDDGSHVSNEGITMFDFDRSQPIQARYAAEIPYKRMEDLIQARREKYLKFLEPYCKVKNVYNHHSVNTTVLLDLQ